MTTVLVHIRGTPMKFTISFDRISLQKKSGYYVPGNIIRHDAIGLIKCEEIQFGPDLQPSRVICSIVDNKPNESARKG